MQKTANIEESISYVDIVPDGACGPRSVGLSLALKILEDDDFTEKLCSKEHIAFLQNFNAAIRARAKEQQTNEYTDIAGAKELKSYLKTKGQIEIQTFMATVVRSIEYYIFFNERKFENEAYLDDFYSHILEKTYQHDAEEQKKDYNDIIQRFNLHKDDGQINFDGLANLALARKHTWISNIELMELYQTLLDDSPSLLWILDKDTGANKQKWEELVYETLKVDPPEQNESFDDYAKRLSKKGKTALAHINPREHPHPKILFEVKEGQGPSCGGGVSGWHFSLVVSKADYDKKFPNGPATKEFNKPNLDSTFYEMQKRLENEKSHKKPAYVVRQDSLPGEPESKTSQDKYSIFAMFSAPFFKILKLLRQFIISITKFVKDITTKALQNSLAPFTKVESNKRIPLTSRSLSQREPTYVEAENAETVHASPESSAVRISAY